MNFEFLGAIGALLGAVAALMPTMIVWLKDRSNVGKRRNHLELAKLEIDFLASWLDAVSGMEGSSLQEKRALVEQQLEDILLATSKYREASVEKEAPTKTKPSMLSSVLLYGYLGFYLFMALGASIEPETNTVSLATLMLGENLILLAVFGVPLILLYLNQRRSRRQKGKT